MRSDYDRIMVFSVYYYMCLHLDSQRDQFTNTKYSCNKWDVVKTELHIFFFKKKNPKQTNNKKPKNLKSWISNE